MQVGRRKTTMWMCWFLVKLEFGSVGFWGEGKTGVPEEKPLWARERTNNKLNPHMVSTPGFEPGPHWWEASVHTTAPPLLPQKLLVNLQWKMVHEYCVNNYLAQALYCMIHYNCKLHYITSILYAMSPLTCYTSHAQTFPQQTLPHYKCIQMIDILRSKCHEISNKTCPYFVILDGCSCKRQSIIACGAHLNIFAGKIITKCKYYS